MNVERVSKTETKPARAPTVSSKDSIYNIYQCLEKNPDMQLLPSVGNSLSGIMSADGICLVVLLSS